MLESLLFVAALATDPAPTPVPGVVSCMSQPGTALCGQLDDLLVDYTTSCSGDPCSTLWWTQANDDLALLQAIETSLVPTSQIGGDLAAKAQQVAAHICATQRTSVDTYAYQAVEAENKLLPHLADLQLRGGYTEPTTCAISIN